MQTQVFFLQNLCKHFPKNAGLFNTFENIDKLKGGHSGFLSTLVGAMDAEKMPGIRNPFLSSSSNRTKAIDKTFKLISLKDFPKAQDPVTKETREPLTGHVEKDPGVNKRSDHKAIPGDVLSAEPLLSSLLKELGLDSVKTHKGHDVVGRTKADGAAKAKVLLTSLLRELGVDPLKTDKGHDAVAGVQEKGPAKAAESGDRDAGNSKVKPLLSSLLKELGLDSVKTHKGHDPAGHTKADGAAKAIVSSDEGAGESKAKVLLTGLLRELGLDSLKVDKGHNMGDQVKAKAHVKPVESDDRDAGNSKVKPLLSSLLKELGLDPVKTHKGHDAAGRTKSDGAAKALISSDEGTGESKAKVLLASLLKELGVDSLKMDKGHNMGDQQKRNGDIEPEKLVELGDKGAIQSEAKVLLTSLSKEPGKDPLKMGRDHVTNDQAKGKAIFDGHGGDVTQGLSKKVNPVKSNPGFQWDKQGTGEPSGDSTNQVFAAETMHGKIQILDRDSGADKVIRTNSDNAGNALLSSYNRSSDPASDTVFQSKATDLFQKSIQSEVLTQVVEKAALDLKSGQTSIRINLRPEHLGHLRMRISTVNHQVVVKVLAEVPLVKEIIESNINQLRADLQNHGLEIDKFDVFVDHNAYHNSGEYERRSPGRTEHETGEAERNAVLPKEHEETIQYAREISGQYLIDYLA